MPPKGPTVAIGARYGVWVGDKRGGGSRGAARISSSDMVWVSTYPPSGFCKKKQFGGIYSQIFKIVLALLYSLEFLLDVYLGCTLQRK